MTVHVRVAVAVPPAPLARTTAVCEPGASPESTAGLAAEANGPPSTDSSTRLEFVASQEIEAFVAAVSAGGPSVIDTLGAGAAVTVQRTVALADWRPRRATILSEWAPARRPAYATGLAHDRARAPSSEQVVAEGEKPKTPKEMVAVVALVVAGGACVTTTDGAAPAAGADAATSDAATAAIPRALRTKGCIDGSPGGVSDSTPQGYPERGGRARGRAGPLAGARSVRYLTGRALSACLPDA